MKTNVKSLALACGLAVMAFVWGAGPARAQGFSFGYAGPGVSVGVNTGGFGYGGAVYGGYPVVAPAPVVVAPYAPVVVPRPVVVGRPFLYGPRPFYGPRVYGGGYRPMATPTIIAAEWTAAACESNPLELRGFDGMRLVILLPAGDRWPLRPGPKSYGSARRPCDHSAGRNPDGRLLLGTRREGRPRRAPRQGDRPGSRRCDRRRWSRST